MRLRSLLVAGLITLFVIGVAYRRPVEETRREVNTEV